MKEKMKSKERKKKGTLVISKDGPKRVVSSRGKTSWDLQPELVPDPWQRLLSRRSSCWSPWDHPGGP